MVAAVPYVRRKTNVGFTDNLVAYCPEGHAMKSDEL